ncbi:putative HTH-type transcriptional regulator [Roseobacter fucihabitans]|uniref:HTH-type transcriptional regulator n=1 Tax=Roseobacter fucihabitans TaxID=1537242 RepID=A0ABZ2BYQ4_9RHOB|nr:LysR family transcriptional regulator ArgP [Roseobacter litoralis]MBC6964852.1 putative HTH-type transcriptional regulator [Roseobacter litoralis]
MSIDPHQLAALAAIVRHGSFDAAAAHLHVTPSAISQRIKALEEQMGTALIYRAHPCRPTASGTRLARHADDVALLESHVLSDIAPAARTSAPRVRVAVNADSLATWFITALADAPGMLFELVIDDQDTSWDWLLRGAVSAALTGQATAVSGCNCQALGALRYVATASPDFMARWFSSGVTAEHLKHAPLLTFNAKDRLQHRWMTQITGEKLSPPAHQLRSTQAFIDATLAGLGWGLNPLPLVQHHLQRGTLVPVIDDEPLDVSLYWQTSRLMSAALDPLTRAVKTAARQHLVNTPHATVTP